VFNRVLTSEIHFLRKVAGPTAEELAPIRKAGAVAAEKAALKLAELQANNQHHNCPDLRQMIVDAVRAEAEKVLPADTARRYGEELDARLAARKEAAVGMVVAIIDREIALTGEQHAGVTEAVAENWKDQWSRNFQALTYDEYAPMPEASVLLPHLNERQQTLWKARAHHGGVFFGWEQEFEGGIEGAAELTELHQYPAEKSAPARAEKPEPAETSATAEKPQ
jgi:hypothetical protein